MKKSSWIIFITNGVIALLFGLLLLLMKQATILGLVRIFGVVLLAAGLIMFYFSYRNMKAGKSYVIIMIEAVVAALIGLIIAINPGRSLNLFLTLLGVWAAIMGLLQIVFAVRMRKKVSQPFLFTLNGIITLVVGLLLFYSPRATFGTLTAIIGVLALAAGLLMIFLGIKLKGVKE
jgi:uncharacterized membrane protein HdeD (DUF308 family)